MGSDELVARLRKRGLNHGDFGVASMMYEAADRIEALTAQLAEARESERAALTEREAQTKLDGVKAGIQASAVCSNSRRKNRFSGIEWQTHNDAVDDVTRNIRALDAEAIAKGEA